MHVGGCLTKVVVSVAITSKNATSQTHHILFLTTSILSQASLNSGYR
jgi:hypothetical protein